jgi:hypothetical protein
MRTGFIILCLVGTLLSENALATKLLVPMSATEQGNHLKAYGVMYAALQQGVVVDWLLNYKGGSYGLEYDPKIAKLCQDRGVTFVKMSNTAYNDVIAKVMAANSGGDVVKLEKPPRIAVYTPLTKEPWDDAVTLALTYAEIPFDKIYAGEVLTGALDHYDWLHLHHEDFTGQYGKFYGQFRLAEWYKNDQKTLEHLAAKNGFKKVAAMQLAVVKKIRSFVSKGGNMFAMCSATDTYDIALAADGTDICDSVFDGDPMDKNAQSKLDFNNCFAFRNFLLVTDPMRYEYSSIDNTDYRYLPEPADSFTLTRFPVKPDPVPAMLTQNHTNSIKGFMGQTTAFRMEVLKPGVEVLGSCKLLNEARYIHGDYGKGTWTFYGGHDPEAYQHRVNDPVTDLSLHPNSPGYRLILNNVLFPAAKRVTVPTVYYPDAHVTAKPAEPAAKTDTNMPMTQRVKISPNADNMQLTISMAGKIKEVVITNFAGKEIFTNKYDAEQISLDMSYMLPGLYLINVNGVYAGKIIKN